MTPFLILGITQGAKPFPIELESHRKPSISTRGNCIIRAGRVITATHGTLENTDIEVINGKITRIGKNLVALPGTTVINAKDKVVAPGIVDGHSHRASDGTNEGSESITAEVRIGDVLNLQALTAWQALASGHTSALILHGSANNVGGQSVVIKYKYGRPSAEAPVRDAPRMIKFALGENVTRKTDTTGSRFPRTRMGQEAVYRRGFNEARQYISDWKDFESGKSVVRPRKDLRLETLADILQRKVWVQCHSYRSDEMLMMVRLSQDYGFKIGAMQHALEAYKIAPELAKAGVGVSIFVDSWSFKQEGYDAIPWNASICQKAGVNVSINTDGVSGTTALNVDAAKTMRFGGFTEEQAIRTITLNPAKELGIDHRTGSIDIGKDADFGIWDGHPLSVYAKCAMTLVEGEVFFQRRDAFGVDKIGLKKTVLDRQVNATENQSSLPKGTFFHIQGADVHTISGPVITNGDVVVKNGMIVQVGSKLKTPVGATLINAKGLHVYPGMFDGPSSIGLAEIGPIPVMVDNRELGSYQPDLDALTALWVESTHFGPAKFNGVTNAFTVPSSGTVAGQGAVINTDGLTTEQFAVARKHALVLNYSAGGRNFDFDLCDVVDSSMLFGGPVGRGNEHLSVQQLEDYYNFLGGAMPVQGPPNNSSNSALDAYFDKAIAYMKKRETDKGATLDTQLEAMIPFIKGQKMVVLNARNAAAIRGAVAFIQKYKLKGVIAGASEAWRETALLKKSGIPVIISPAGKSTLGANTTDNAWDPYDTPYVSPGLLAKAGVKFCFASGGGSDVMNLPERVGQSCAYGLSKEDAMKAVTLWPAQILGVSDKLGSVEAGKMANIIVTDGDPFEMTTTMRYVFIGGTPRALTSKHTMLRDKYIGRK